MKDCGSENVRMEFNIINYKCFKGEILSAKILRSPNVHVRPCKFKRFSEHNLVRFENLNNKK